MNGSPPQVGQCLYLGLSLHRDAQRVEELCAKNHQLREQQKSLKENVRVLENRWASAAGEGKVRWVLGRTWEALQQTKPGRSLHCRTSQSLK